MEQKTISINPNLFQMSKSTTASPKKKKNMSLKIQKPTNIKRDLIKKIRNYQNKTKKRKNYPIDSEFNSEFKDSIEYLRNVMSEKKMIERDKLDIDSDTIPSNRISSLPNSDNQNLPTTDTPHTMQPPVPNMDIPWGNMKNGNKPTYRTWMRHKQTQKMPKEIDHQKTKSYVARENLSEAQFPVQNSVHDAAVYKLDDSHSVEKPQKKKIKKKTIRKKYTCGKSKTKKQIAIIIKGLETKNKVLREQRELKKESIQNIKNYLYKKSFIKVGSTAPDKVLRDMYESLILTGDVNNKNSHILIHNYMNENI